MNDVEIELTDAPDQASLDVILSGLVDFNIGEMGASPRVPLALLIRDDDGAVIGGLSGMTTSGWLFIQLIFVPETLRGRGMAPRLIAMAESEALRRGCHGAWIDTFNPHALAVYTKAGYRPFGELPEYPKGRTRFFLSKFPLGSP